MTVPTPADPFSIVAKDILVAQGLGTFGQTVFIGSEPDEPNDCITLYDVAGTQSPNPKFLLEYPGLMIRVRSSSYAQGHKTAEQCKDVLLGLPSQTINGIRYDGVYCLVDTYFLKADEKGRHIFVNTWRCIREPSTGTNRQPL